MAIDIDKLSAKELDALINQARKRRTTLSKRKPVAQVRKKLLQLIKAEGYTVAELFGTGKGNAGEAAASGKRAATGGARKTARKSAAAGSKVAPKYRNPDNASETWTGRGKQPRWLAAQTSQGRALDEFLIK